MGIIMLIQIFLSEKEINVSPVVEIFYLLHTIVGWCLITGRNADSLFSLIMAEVFSASIMNSMQTALFSLADNSSESFIKINIMYCVSYVVSVMLYFYLVYLRKVKKENL